MLFFFFHFYVKTQCNKLVFSGAGATASLDLGAAYSGMAGLRLTLYFFTIKTKILQKIILLYTVSGSIMSSNAEKTPFGRTIHTLFAQRPKINVFLKKKFEWRVPIP